jgi:hypothetical protein
MTPFIGGIILTIIVFLILLPDMPSNHPDACPKCGRVKCVCWKENHLEGLVLKDQPRDRCEHSRKQSELLDQLSDCLHEGSEDDEEDAGHLERQTADGDLLGHVA